MVGDTGWEKIQFLPIENFKNGVFLCSDMLALELRMSKSYFKFSASTASKDRTLKLDSFDIFGPCCTKN